MPPSHAAVVTNWFTSRWEFGPKVNIAPTARDLPFPAPEDVRGAYWRGEVHLVAEQPVSSLVQAIAHEAVGHHGLRELFGADWPHFMGQVVNGLLAGDPGLKQVQGHIRATYLNDKGEYLLSARQEADEVAAYVAEDMVCFMSGTIKPDRPWTQALAAARGWFLREGLCLDGSVTRSELEGALFLASKKMEGWPWQRATRRIGQVLRACCTIAGMSKDDRYRPPMSVEESERLLRSEEERLESVALWKGFGKGLLQFFLYAIGAALLIFLVVEIPFLRWIAVVGAGCYLITLIAGLVSKR
ncbi:MAG: hypothetical protein LBE61_09700 [Burkholderiaceae bacterium]|jgi:hypothetical protein|nr:hypothetical protein [Burkholderiaceae bacterium]